MYNSLLQLLPFHVFCCIVPGSPSLKINDHESIGWQPTTGYIIKLASGPTIAIIPSSNFNSFEGVVYCRPHFDQIFKRTGSLETSFEGTPKILKPNKLVDNENANKVSSLFAGTRDKCVGCNMTAYPIEKVTINGASYHRNCFKCCYGGLYKSIQSNYIAHEGRLYCKHHHIQLFKAKGNYSQLESDMEEESLLS